jgi:multicomponent Na+:H+ antiporter subunit G
VTDVIVAALLIIGAFFVTVAAVGVHRLRDTYSRLHAATKAGTLGLTSILIASAIEFWAVEPFATRQILTIVFLFLTVPAAAHLIATVGYRLGAPRWDRTWLDEAKGKIPRQRGIGPRYRHLSIEERPRRPSIGPD